MRKTKANGANSPQVIDSKTRAYRLCCPPSTRDSSGTEAGSPKQVVGDKEEMKSRQHLRL